MDTQKKREIVQQYRVSENDTGSPEVQCALFTAKIQSIIQHLHTAKKDFSSRRGLVMLVNSRRRLLQYLKKKSSTRYSELIKKLGIRK
ncbi:30S ribosomal protein S15 [Candidatus Fokinia crypta]|uniref:Small ribosomal subunit protein uS15 n=1 Tax=Candidatus Fokinia crypta TaxID=1920990 RepID=A0ABZ0UPA7_9RICK|nr:30S ribosomal protein S15 [Candidatus Fokinia cryptica]WPX97956.1 30S ribosomal protein S15 [Candidatus Fokinia cryptica]